MAPLPLADRASLAAALKNQLGSLTLKGLEPAAMSSASEALKSLAPGQYTAADLVQALNLMSVEFDTGSASINAASVAVLGDAAAALKNAPGTRVEIGGRRPLSMRMRAPSRRGQNAAQDDPF